MPEGTIWICPHCHGWSSNHIPVKNNFELCKTCFGDGVLVNYGNRVLYWGEPKFIDLRPKLLKAETYARINIRKQIFPLILIIILVIAIVFYLTNGNAVTGFLTR